MPYITVNLHAPSALGNLFDCSNTLMRQSILSHMSMLSDHPKWTGTKHALCETETDYSLGLSVIGDNRCNLL